MKSSLAIALAGFTFAAGVLLATSGCATETPQESTHEPAASDENTATREAAFFGCSGETPYVCHRQSIGFCMDGNLCGTGCPCECEWYCCDYPENSCP